MAIGNQPAAGLLNSRLTQYMSDMDLWCQKVFKLQAYVTLNGSAGLIGTGMDSGDATAYITAVGYLNTVAEVYNGLAAVTPAQNFLAELTAVAGLQ